MVYIDNVKKNYNKLRLRRNFHDFFIVGLAILIIGAFIYGRYVENVFGPDDRQTPATRLADGIDYVEMPKWKKPAN